MLGRVKVDDSMVRGLKRAKARLRVSWEAIAELIGIPARSLHRLIGTGRTSPITASIVDEWLNS